MPGGGELEGCVRRGGAEWWCGTSAFPQASSMWEGSRAGRTANLTPLVRFSTPPSVQNDPRKPAIHCGHTGWAALIS